MLFTIKNSFENLELHFNKNYFESIYHFIGYHFTHSTVPWKILKYLKYLSTIIGSNRNDHQVFAVGSDELILAKYGTWLCVSEHTMGCDIVDSGSNSMGLANGSKDSSNLEILSFWKAPRI